MSFSKMPHQCIHCYTFFSCKSKLNEHSRIHTKVTPYDGPYPCSHCDKTFSLRSTLLLHLRAHTGVKPLLALQCGQCDKAFILNSHIISHMKTHIEEKSYQCSNCKQSFSSKILLITHMKTHTADTPYQCSRCDKAFSNNLILLRHLRTHIQKKSYPDVDILDIPLVKQKELDDDIEVKEEDMFGIIPLVKHDLDAYVEVKEGDSIIENPYQCSHCEKAFSKKCRLKTHMRTHNGVKVKLYKCSHCDKSFRYSSFKRNIHLISHLRTNTGEKLYICSDCDLACSHKYIRYNTEEKPYPYECIHCGEAFSSQASLVRHLRKLIQNKKYPASGTFVCHVCNKSVNSKEDLDIHQNIHKNISSGRNLDTLTLLNPEELDWDIEFKEDTILDTIPSVKQEKELDDIQVKVEGILNTIPSVKQAELNTYVWLKEEDILNIMPSVKQEELDGDVDIKIEDIPGTI